MRSFLPLLLAVAFAVLPRWSANAWADQHRPNVLWFVVDDMSANFSCYGETLVQTPHVDRLAREGVLFNNAHVTAPVCSTCRSAFITGMHQTSIGAHNHRMTRPPVHLPRDVVPLPVLFREAGYFTCNGDGLRHPSGKVRGKTDYNFVYDKSLYDGKDWEERKKGQPFFMQIQMAGGKLRGANLDSFERTRRRSQELFGDQVDASKVQLPPYYPDDPVFRNDWAAYLESVRQTDHHVGQILQRLEEEGILDQTLIIFMTDHGISHARGKQFNYREGTHIPFVVRPPAAGLPGAPRGSVREDFIEHIDMAAISLAAAGIPLPPGMQAQNVFAKGYQLREVAFTARDRCDETIDFIRSARTKDYLYIRNYNPFRPYLQPSRYKDNKVLLKRLREMRNEGKLSELQFRLLFVDRRAGEELYDLSVDPYETRNVAKEPEYAANRNQLRAMLDRHLLRTRDAGFVPEPTISEICQRHQSVRAFCQSDADYPLEEILRLANLASSKDPQNAPVFKKQLRHQNAIVRYWAAMGLRVLENASVTALHDLRNTLQDKDASVRITAAYTLARFGDDGMRDFLLAEAKKAKTDAHALWALDAVKYLDTPQVLKGFTQRELVKGQYSGRAFDFLSKGGLVFGTGTDYWNPAE